MNKDKKMLFGIGIVFLFLATVGFTYAYFTATIVNKDVKDQVVQTGTLELTYTDGPEIIMNNIKPGATITKEVSVKNTGTLDASYNLVWQELANEIINDEMVIEATCTRLNANGVEEGTCESLSSTPIKRIKVKENVSIEANITHKYNITITFKEISADQNYNQGKSFTGTLGINEYVENTPIYCTFDGELTQGAEYVNGQYTYRYMQELTISWDDDNDKRIYLWGNIDEDGWGVSITNRDSTEPVTSKLCTYINNKPVVSMFGMFADSQAKKIDLSNFDTSNVTRMEGMFLDSQATILDLSSFDTSNVTRMEGMFLDSQATILDLSSFDTSKVTDMSFMFTGSQATTLDLSNFDTSKVTDMSFMFNGSQATTLDLSNFDTSSVTDMSFMFSESRIFNLDLSNFDTSNVVNMQLMFSYVNVTSVDLSSFDTSKVTNMRAMFEGTKAKTLDVSSFDTSNVTDMSVMFNAASLQQIDLSSFNTSKVTDMNCMFLNSKTFSIDLSSFDTSAVTNMGSMFLGSKVTTIYASDKFVTDNLTSSSGMFSNTKNLVGGNGTKYNSSYTDKTYARIDTASTPGYFTLKTN